jgi:putative protein-disulfide isomerase
MPKKMLYFVLDPMCSWCWGFAPIVDAVREAFGETYAISPVMGGLRGKGEMQWDADAKNHLRKHWQAVAKKTGQPFDESLLEKEHFEYDTTPACKAVVTVRELLGEDAAFRYLHAIEHAFYAQGIDITKPRLLQGYYEQLFGNSGKFAFFFLSERAEVLTEHDFAKARSMGANSFPSIVLVNEAGHMVCQKGYRSFEEIATMLGEKDA